MNTVKNNLFSVTAPLCIRNPAGVKKLMVECFATSNGVVFFEPFWNLQDDYAGFIHCVEGTISGSGPWKIGDYIVTVLGCQGTDPDLANLQAEWQQYRMTDPDGYPSNDTILKIAGKYAQVIP